MATRLEAIAELVLSVLDGNRQTGLFTAADPNFSNADAYAVAAALRALRIARGERPVGRKIGFTNRGIWAEYRVYEPIWGDMYDTTVQDVERTERVAVMQWPEPRIEPEIVLGLARDLHPGMTPDQIASSVGWVAHGFEIVQSIYPGWKFKAADCIVDNGLHGRLFVGPRHAADEIGRGGLAAALSRCAVSLSLDGVEIDSGTGANALDGPIEALCHLVAVLGRDRLNPPLRAGEIVTTGTLTRAFPVLPGQRWTTRIGGIGLEGMAIEIA